MGDGKHNVKFGALLKEMAENSSLHGIPKIVSSKYKYQKILWLFLVLGTSGYLCYQTTQLFTAFYGRPIKTSVSLQFSRLRFPAISICNMNPIRKQYLNLANEDILSILDYELHRRKKRATHTDDTGSSSSSVSLAPTATCQYDCDVTATASVSSTDVTSSTADVSSSIMPSFESHDGSSTQSHSNTGWQGTDDSSDTTNSLTNDYISDTDYNSYSSYYSKYDYYFDEWEAPKDKWQERIEKFREAFQNESKEIRSVMGHSLQDMLMSCSFATKKCYAENFTSFRSPDYGNCYTISQEKFITARTGPLYGLWLTLNLEVNQYITNYASAFGIRLVIHEQGTYPFPAEEGLTLSPGHETTVGIKMINVSRLGQPYGDCNDGVEFQKTFGIRYTIPACVQLCKQRWIVDSCGCVSANIEVDIAERAPGSSTPKDTPTRICDQNNVKDNLCMRVVHAKYNRGELECFCESPCREKVYAKTISGRAWPNDDYLRFKLMREFCAKELPYAFEDCDEFKNTINTFPLDRYKNNFLSVILYYEDLNHEFIKEDPLYDDFRFVSDIGGTLGLFMGASILSAFEIVHLVLEVVNFLRKKATAVDDSRIQSTDVCVTDYEMTDEVVKTVPGYIVSCEKKALE